MGALVIRNRLRGILQHTDIGLGRRAIRSVARRAHALANQKLQLRRDHHTLPLSHPPPQKTEASVRGEARTINSTSFYTFNPSP